MKNKLIMTSGLPRSGKSTYSRTLGHPMVNPDSIRLAYGVVYEPKLESHVWAVAETMVSALFIAGHPVVVLDATNLTRERRRRWISKDYDTEIHIVKASPEVITERAKQSGFPLEVIEKMRESMEPPDKSEGFSRIVSVLSFPQDREEMLRMLETEPKDKPYHDGQDKQ